jgi:predicted NUDIX family NTP pyrophosphohydrolase
MKQSAGLLIYRRNGDKLEVLLVHPSGNYNRRAPWGIPKGLPDEGESLLYTAVRETREETGVQIISDAGKTPDSMVTSLGHIDYARSRKRVYAFAVESPPDAAPHTASWEVDRAEFLPIDEAERLMHVDQKPFLERLVEWLNTGQLPPE